MSFLCEIAPDVFDRRLIFSPKSSQVAVLYTRANYLVMLSGDYLKDQWTLTRRQIDQPVARKQITMFHTLLAAVTAFRQARDLLDGAI